MQNPAPIAVSGSATHTISLEAHWQGVSGAYIFSADDFAITLVTPPIGQALC